LLLWQETQILVELGQDYLVVDAMWQRVVELLCYEDQARAAVLAPQTTGRTCRYSCG